MIDCHYSVRLRPSQMREPFFNIRILIMHFLRVNNAKSRRQTATVSYTHLDVYKRQGYNNKDKLT